MIRTDPMGKTRMREQDMTRTNTGAAASEPRGVSELYLDILGHDINNQNQSLITLLDLLLDSGSIEGSTREDILMARDQALAISNLIRNLQKLNDLKNNRRERIDMDVYYTLQYCLKHIYQSRLDKEVHVEHDLRPGEVLIWGDDHLEDIFNNILSNAVKHNRNKSVRIEVVHDLVDGFWRLEFRDNGIGIPDPMKKKVFQRLLRGTSSVHGSGLGLAVVENVVRHYGGKVFLADRIPGDHTRGANLVLMLPVGECQGIAAP